MNYLFALIGIAVMYLITLFLRRVYLASYNKENKIKAALKYTIKAFLWIGSLDFSLARLHKNKIKAKYPEKETQKDQLSQYLVTANNANIIVSFLLAVAAYLTALLCNIEWLRLVLFGLIAYRTLSRTLEINIAFLLDCMDKSKDSNLDHIGRIKLAFKSWLEEAFLFAGIYSFALVKIAWWKPLLGGLHSFIFSPFECFPDVFFSFASVYQIICSVILITISFASYISNRDDRKE